MTRLFAGLILFIGLSACGSSYNPDFGMVNDGFELLDIEPTASGGFTIAYRFTNNYTDSLCFGVLKGLTLSNVSGIILTHADGTLVLYNSEAPAGRLLTENEITFETLVVNPGEGFDTVRNIEDETATDDSEPGEPLFFTISFVQPNISLKSVEFCDGQMQEPPTFNDISISKVVPFGPLVFPSGP